jgi:hypothetical protein
MNDAKYIGMDVHQATISANRAACLASESEGAVTHFDAAIVTDLVLACK